LCSTICTANLSAWSCAYAGSPRRLRSRRQWASTHCALRGAVLSAGSWKAALLHAYAKEYMRHTQVQDVVTAADGARSVLKRTSGTKRCALQRLERYITAAHRQDPCSPKNRALTKAGQVGGARPLHNCGCCRASARPGGRLPPNPPLQGALKPLHTLLTGCPPHGRALGVLHLLLLLIIWTGKCV